MCAPRTVSNSRDFQEIRSATSGNPKAASDTGVAAPEAGAGRSLAAPGTRPAVPGPRAPGAVSAQVCVESRPRAASRRSWAQAGDTLVQ